MAGTVLITRRIEFDAGHRIPHHNSKCKNAHGHRYVMEATVIGEAAINPGKSDDGMVVDFGDLKLLMNSTIGDKWDHGFLVYEGDTDMRTALSFLGLQHKTIVVPYVPTVENLVTDAFDKLDTAIKERASRFVLYKVKLWETPNCFADKKRETT